MPSSEMVSSNYASLTIVGQIDCTAAGEVSAVRGDGLSCTYDGTGGADYVLTYKAGGGLRMVKVLHALITVMNTLTCDTTAASISAMTQDADDDDIHVTFATQAAAGGAAAEEATAVFTLNVHLVIQTARMSDPMA